MPIPPKLKRIIFGWPELTDAVAEYVAAIERSLTWSWGEGFHVEDGPRGKVVHYSPEPPARYARTTTGGITARSGSTLGQGTIVMEDRRAATVSDGATELCFSNFKVAVPHPSELVVSWDGSAYALIAADCPS